MSMNLEQEILSNSIKNYLIVLGILFVAFVIKRMVSRFFASLIYTWIVKNNHSELRKSQLHRLVIPIEQFLLFLVAVIALYELKFPAIWNVHLFKLTIKQVIESLTKLIFIILFIRVCLRTLEFVAKILEEKAKLTQDLTDDQLVLFFRDFFKVILYIIGLLLILHYVFNENIGNLVTSLSIVGAAVALSMRESLENIIASFIIFFDKPFTIGDLVKVNNFTGTIEKIGLRSTRIRTQDKTYISVPNKQMVDTIVDNISLRSERKIEMDIQLQVQTSADALSDYSAYLKKYIAGLNSVNSAVVFISDSGKFAHILHLEIYVSIQLELGAFQQLREQINLEAVRYANQHNILFADKA